MKNKIILGAWASIGVFISLIIIFIVLVVMKQGNIKTRSDYAFDYQSYYKPKSSKIDEAVIRSQYTGAGKEACPCVTPYKASYITINTSTGPGAYVISRDSFEDSTYYMTADFGTSWAEAAKVLGYSESEYLAQTVPGGLADNSYYEIIAPFPYIINNRNVDGNVVTITDAGSGSMRITFETVSNWFCAGPRPTEDYADWHNHSVMHNTIIGNSVNSKVTHGELGDVIAYGNEATTITCYKKVAGVWSQCKWSDLFKVEY